jgi:RND family efflux transporter MFP subunit
VNVRPGAEVFKAFAAAAIAACAATSFARDPGYLGVVFSNDAADVSAAVSGTIRRLHVELGREVKQGEILVSLESEDLVSEREQAEAALTTANALAEQARAELDDVDRLLARRRGATEIFPAEQVEALETQREVARTEWEAAKSTAAERAAALREAERRVEALTVRAPFDGAVASCPHEVGARVGAGQTLVRLIGTGDFWVRFAVPSREADWLDAGRAVEVEPERPGDAWSAEIRRVAPEIDPATDMIFVEAAMVVPEGRRAALRSGETVRVRNGRGP